MKCDACQEIFCNDHITYANHKCTSSYKKVMYYLVQPAPCEFCFYKEKKEKLCVVKQGICALVVI